MRREMFGMLQVPCDELSYPFVISPMHDGMNPCLLMQAWMVAHLYGARYQATVCSGGSMGVAAFRESLRPQYTSPRHDARGLRTFYITGTSGGSTISRITLGRIGYELTGLADEPLHITVTSNTRAWEGEDLSYNMRLVSLDLDVERLVEVSEWFLRGCSNLTWINLSPLSAIVVIPSGFLSDCHRLKDVNLALLPNLKEVRDRFLLKCRGLMSISLAPLRAIRRIPSGFLDGCCGLTEVDLSPLVNVQEAHGFFLNGCSGLTSINLAPLWAIDDLPLAFLAGCSGLKEVDLSPLVNVKKVGSHLLLDCPGLSSIILPSQLSADNLPASIRKHVRDAV